MARAQAEQLIQARPDAVYAVLADYQTHHPRIMPSSLFSDLEVESGGVGAGTVFHITLRMLGKRQRLHMKVAEPEPGRVLTETNIDTGAVTEFTVAASDGASSTLTRISSEWQTGGGVRGVIDRLITPLVTRRILTKQLAELNRYMRSGEVPEQQSPQQAKGGTT
jgi:hypothetical protein